MPTRPVTVIVPDDMLSVAAKVIGQASTSVNRLIEAAFRAYSGQPRDEIIRAVYQQNVANENLRMGGRKTALVASELLENIEDEKSYAGRIGLLMLMYNMTKEEAKKAMDGNPSWQVNMGRPRKNKETTDV